MSTTETERRLAAALHARADLVRPEDLRHEPVLPAAVPAHPRWRRAATYVAAVAAAAAAVGATYVLSTDGDPARPQPAPQPGPPEGWRGGVGRTGPAAAAPAQGTLAVDLDGDGLPDTVWVRSRGGDRGLVRVEALLSTQPDDVRWTVLAERAEHASAAGSLPLDTDAADELVVSLDSSSSYEYAVVDLVDGRLQEVPAPGNALRSGRDRATRFVGDRLVSWTSDTPIPDDARYVRVDATWWAIGEVDGERRLVPVETGELCMDFFDALAGACLPGDRPDAEPPDLSGDNQGDVLPDLLPAVGRLGLEERLQLGDGRTAHLTGSADDPTLEIESDDETLALDLGPGDRARLVDGVLDGPGGPTLLVDRGAAWAAYAVRGGALVGLYVADDVPLGTRDGVRTELSRSGVLWTAVDTGSDAGVARVSTWTTDRGPGLLTDQEISCLRFPPDGGDPDYTAC